MNRKQNSLMRFSRIERLAQLSEQEIVIEKKKREIQAKLEAQKKKENEEAFKKLELSKETKSTKSGFSKKALNGNECKKSSSLQKPIKKAQESLINAFTNDGTFLDQFKKLSQSGLSSSCETQTLTTEKKIENNIKNSVDLTQERDREDHNKRDYRVNRDNLEQNEKVSKDTNQLSVSRNSTDLSVAAVNNSKSAVPLLPIQIAQTLTVSDFYSNKILLNPDKSNHSSTVQSVPPTDDAKLCQSLISSNDSPSSAFIQSPETSQNILGPSPKLSSSVTSELPKVRSESISMTLKINTVKKLEAIPNPLETDDTLLPDSQKKNQLSFSEKKSSKSTCLKTSQSHTVTPITEKVFSHRNTSRTFCNVVDDDDDDGGGDDDVDDDNDGGDGDDDADADADDEYENKNEDNGQLNKKHQHWASLVARYGDEFENSLRSCHENDPDLKFLFNKSSNEYLSYRKHVLKYRMRLKFSKEEPPEKSLKLNSPKTYGEHSMGNMFPGDNEFPKTKVSNEDIFKVKECLGPKKTFLDGEEKAKKFSEIPENQIESDKYNSDSEPTFKGQSFSNSQKESLPEETSSQILKGENNVEEFEQLKTEERRKRKRKSRWGDPEPTINPSRIETNLDLQPFGKLPAPKSTLLSQLTRSDPGLIQYARQTFGSTNLSDEDWKKAEDHYKINLLYQDMIKKRAEVEKLEKQGKFKYEYDSDEDTEGGTWEHKLRQQEMQATQLWAEELTRQAAGKHHIGDFLPPEELERFMEKYNAVKEGREPDLSDYKEYKLKEDNVGYRLLQKMGWNEGQGLGQDGSGITNPVNKATTRHENQGLGVERSDGLEPGDDEYDAYRKRMMLAYRFRPNPLNNPRRPYY